MALTDSILAYWNLNNDGSGGVSLLDATGNGYTLTDNGGVTLGTGIIGGDAVFSANNSLSTTSSFPALGYGDFTLSCWVNPSDSQVGFPALISTRYYNQADSTTFGFGFDYNNFNGIYFYTDNFVIQTNAPPIANNWNHLTYVRSSGIGTLYVNGFSVATGADTGNYASNPLFLGNNTDNIYGLTGGLDEVGIWSRALSSSDITSLYNNGAGFTYPFNPALINLYYNNAQEDGDWGNILNWWQNTAFTVQATQLPTSTNPINLYGAVTQNTQGANQCFCSSASFWSADFGAGLTLQATGVVNMQGSSIMAGTTTDGVSMHDSSQLSVTSVVDGNVTMRDSSRAFGSILGNATVYYDSGNGQFPIGGTVTGSVTYLGWPAISPQWFNDKATGGANDGDFSNQANWWTDNNYNVRPINAEGYQQLPDASTDVFIAPNTGIVANSGTANPTINSVTANNSNIQNISITATNGFLFSGNEGVANAVLYGNVVFQDTAYNDHAVIQGKATYKSAASLQYSWGQNSLGNVNAGMYNGSTAFEVNIPTGNSNKGFLSALLGFPWYIRF